ncbi:MAG: amidase, partial [Bosea sp. (in: a-proteobacteria)]
MIDLLSPAHLTAAALREGKVSATELLQAALARIDALNPSLNAVVAQDREAAAAMALESDRRIAAGQPRPLEGLPITIKDAFDVRGLASTGGNPGYKDRLPEEDATAVARLRAAGAVIIGKTNVPFFSFDFQSTNPLHGTTNNPWDLTCSPGGSSGGAAVAVATGMAAFELGSDLGGSIRWPAHATGVFGLKPSWGQVSTWGCIPPPPEKRTVRNGDLIVAGPIARSAADLDLLLPIISGGRDITVPGAALKPPRRTDAKGLRVALWSDDPFAPVDAPVRAAVEQAARLLEAQGAIIDPAARPGLRFEDAFEIYSLLNHAFVAYSLPVKVRAKLQAMAASVSPHDL